MEAAGNVPEKPQAVAGAEDDLEGVLARDAIAVFVHFVQRKKAQADSGALSVVPAQGGKMPAHQPRSAEQGILNGHHVQQFQDTIGTIMGLKHLKNLHSPLLNVLDARFAEDDAPRAQIQLPQKSRFPGSHHAGSDRGYVNISQDQQLLQPIQRARLLGDFLQRVEIVDIAPQGVFRKQQVFLNEEFSGFDLFPAQPEALHHLLNQFISTRAMVLPMAFARIVKQHRQHQRLRALDVMPEGRQAFFREAIRQILARFQGHDAFEQGNRPNGMLVHGISMVEIVTHQELDLLQFGKKFR